MLFLNVFVYAIMLPALFISRCSSSVASLSRRKRFHRSLIYPGTKWCGLGNEAKNNEDLVKNVETDKCCRSHDHCKEYIPGFGSIGETRNDLPYTISHCDCDSEFYHCLKKANTETAKSVGRIFFNDLEVPCFIWQTVKTCRKGNSGKCQDERKAVLQTATRFCQLEKKCRASSPGLFLNALQKALGTIDN